MRVALLLTMLAACPAAAEPQGVLDEPCMSLIGPMVYGPETLDTSVTAGVIFGFGLARGFSEGNIGEFSAGVAEYCVENRGKTFLEVLEAVAEQD